MSSFASTFPARASEWALGLIVLNISLLLRACPDLLSNSLQYNAMTLWMAQDTWADLCLVVGGGRLVVLAINGYWRRTPHLRSLAAFLSAFLWFQVTMGLLDSPAPSMGLVTFPVLLLLDAFNAVRAFGEAGLSDRIHKRMAPNGHRT